MRTSENSVNRKFNFGEFTFYEANLANNHATYRRSEAWQNAFAG